MHGRLENFLSSTKIQIEYLGAMSSSVTIPVVASAPGLFTADASGTSQVVERYYPATIGTNVTLLVTGKGQTVPAGVDGKIAITVLPKPVLPVSVQSNYVGCAPVLPLG